VRVRRVEHFVTLGRGKLLSHRACVFTERPGDAAPARPPEPDRQTRFEHLLLANQFRILEKLSPDDARSFAESREALECGYELHYGNVAGFITDETLSADNCREVLNILTMFAAIQRAWEALADRSGIDEYRTRFDGFDGNRELAQMEYCRYYCGLGGGRFRELPRGDDFNSHTERLPRYQRMLAEWQKSADVHTLTRDDLLRITNVVPT
jgi:uncharacterized protein YfbU (UPF0304 family)